MRNIVQRAFNCWIISTMSVDSTECGQSSAWAYRTYFEKFIIAAIISVIELWSAQFSIPAACLLLLHQTFGAKVSPPHLVVGRLISTVKFEGSSSLGGSRDLSNSLSNTLNTQTDICFFYLVSISLFLAHIRWALIERGSSPVKPQLTIEMTDIASS